MSSLKQDTLIHLKIELSQRGYSAEQIRNARLQRKTEPDLRAALKIVRAGGKPKFLTGV